MRTPSIRFVLFLTTVCILCQRAAHGQAIAQTQLDLEAGPVFTGLNDVRIPGDGGTPFSLKDDLQSETTGYLRLRLTHTFLQTHVFSLLYAPLAINSEGRLDKELFYNGTIFPANTNLEGLYQFNSYRLTYRYLSINRPAVMLGLGLTLKVRDANIRLMSEQNQVDRKSVGLVPLPNFYLRLTLDDVWGVLFEGDAYAGPGGRAIDLQLAMTYEVKSDLMFRAGYRILDGGASNERVYGFARFHYAAFGATYSF